MSLTIVLVFVLLVLIAVSGLSVAVLGCTKKKKKKVVEYNMNEDSDLKDTTEGTKNEQKDKEKEKTKDNQLSKPADHQTPPDKSAYYGQQSTVAPDGQSHYYDSSAEKPSGDDDYAPQTTNIEAEPLTADEKNKLNAKILKAEMMGNQSLVVKLKRKLELGVREHDITQSSSEKSSEILLTHTDYRTGLTIPATQKKSADLRIANEEDTFCCLPFCARVAEKILCMHGGLSPDLQTWQQLLSIRRPIDPSDCGLLTDLLWSDPEPSIRGWHPNTHRSVSYAFGADVVEQICKKLDIDLVARAHQVVQDGYEFFAQRRLVTIFSAPKYCGIFDNAAAIMTVGPDLICSFTIGISSSINDMIREEKMTTAEDQAIMYGDLKASSSKVDDDWTVDDVLINKKKSRKKREREERRNREQAVADHKRSEQTLDSCIDCIDSAKFKKHLLVAVGVKTYLCVLPCRSLVDGHCLIVPMMHVASSLQLDEDVFAEMKIWRKGLVAMFRDRDEDCIFIETAKNIRHQPHMAIECIPVPQEIGETAPIYFKKAILECEEEWSQNKKLVDLSKKDIRRSIPKGFSYFAVDFGLEGGFAHVIEDERHFNSYFGKEIIGGMLDLDHNLWRKPAKESFDEQSEKVAKLKEMWLPYDWTEKAKKAIQRKDDDDDSDSD